MQVRTLLIPLLPLLSSPADQVDSLYDGVPPRRPATPASIDAGLGAQGNALIPEFIWTDLNLPSALPRLSTHPPRFCSLDSFMFLHTLVRDGFLCPLPPQPGIPVFTTYKTPVQARLIADARAFNRLWGKPPSFALPNFSALLPALARATYYFCEN